MHFLGGMCGNFFVDLETKIVEHMQELHIGVWQVHGICSPSRDGEIFLV